MDWKTGIQRLIDSGMTVREIAERSGLSVSGVYDLRNGYTTEPRGMAAVKLHEMIQAIAPMKEAA